jgi:hypothetical protein
MRPVLMGRGMSNKKKSPNRINLLRVITKGGKRVTTQHYKDSESVEWLPC